MKRRFPDHRGKKQLPATAIKVQERSGRRHLHRLFGFRNGVSADDRDSSGLAQLARGRPPAVKIALIAETKWGDHAV
jgi:hypothetical protein